MKPRVHDLLYALNLSLLSTHQVDASYQHEWDVFGVPGGIEFFLVFNLAAILALAVGLRAVATRDRHARAWALACAGTGALTCGIHAAFLARDPSAFSTPISLGILAAILVTSTAQVYLAWQRGAVA